MTSSIFTKLDEWRLGRAGVALFYGYLLAILIVMFIIGCGVRKVEGQQHALDSQQARSCAAIEGAVTFWKVELHNSEITLHDPFVSRDLKAATERKRDALRLVIAKAKDIECR